VSGGKVPSTLSKLFVRMLQFEPERFVEGLLGIGVAGGSGSSKSKTNEGAILAARLVVMRKERDARDKLKKVAAPAAARAANPSPQQVMANAPSPNEAPQKPHHHTKNKKKKSKGKK
jgi:hypothetical protein